MEDVLIDDDAWAIRYLVVDTRNWWPGKKVLIAPEWIGWMSWMELKVHVGLRRAVIRGAPEYDPSRAVDPDYEDRLATYYGQPPHRPGPGPVQVAREVR